MKYLNYFFNILGAIFMFILIDGCATSNYVSEKSEKGCSTYEPILIAKASQPAYKDELDGKCIELSGKLSANPALNSMYSSHYPDYVFYSLWDDKNNQVHIAVQKSVADQLLIAPKESKVIVHCSRLLSTGTFMLWAADSYTISK